MKRLRLFAQGHEVSAWPRMSSRLGKLTDPAHLPLNHSGFDRVVCPDSDGVGLLDN